MRLNIFTKGNLERRHEFLLSAGAHFAIELFPNETTSAAECRWRAKHLICLVKRLRLRRLKSIWSKFSRLRRRRRLVSRLEEQTGHLILRVRKLEGKVSTFGARN